MLRDALSSRLFGPMSMKAPRRIHVLLPSGNDLPSARDCQKNKTGRPHRQEDETHDEAPEHRDAEPRFAAALDEFLEDVRHEEVGSRDEHGGHAPLVAVAAVDDPHDEPEARQVPGQEAEGVDHSRDDTAEHGEFLSLAQSYPEAALGELPEGLPGGGNVDHRGDRSASTVRRGGATGNPRVRECVLVPSRTLAHPPAAEHVQPRAHGRAGSPAQRGRGRSSAPPRPAPGRARRRW